MPKDTRGRLQGDGADAGWGRRGREAEGEGGADASPTILQQHFEEAARDEDHRRRRCREGRGGEGSAGIIKHEEKKQGLGKNIKESHL